MSERIHTAGDLTDPKPLLLRIAEHTGVDGPIRAICKAAAGHLAQVEAERDTAVKHGIEWAGKAHDMMQERDEVLGFLRDAEAERAALADRLDLAYELLYLCSGIAEDHPELLARIEAWREMGPWRAARADSSRYVSLGDNPDA